MAMASRGHGHGKSGPRPPVDREKLVLISFYHEKAAKQPANREVDWCKTFIMVRIRSVRHGVFKGVEDCFRLPALPETAPLKRL
jgi:hypothetical protein